MTSSIGRKIIVALTGLCLVLFLAGHLAGNLLIFGGPEWINTYAHGLHSMPEAALWGNPRGACGDLHHPRLADHPAEAGKPCGREPYVFKNTIKATLSSRYMIYTGLTVLVFLIYHLYQYTLRVGYDPAQFTTFISDGTVETFDVYKMIVTGFSNVWCSAFYILAVLMLFSHLRHGVQSIFQTVGIDSRKIRPFYNFIAIAYGAIICLGFISVPVSVLLGIIK